MSDRRTLRHNGCELQYALAGSGHPVLMIQGVGVHGDGWGLQVQGMSYACQCLTFDNRGMGKSQPCAGDLSVELMADDALALMDAVGWKSAHVVGHSLGGLIAQQLALAAPQRVRSLSLLCTFPRGREVVRPTLRIMWIGMRMRIGSRRSRRRAFLELILSRRERSTGKLDDWAQKLEPIFGHDLADTPAIVKPQLRALGRFDPMQRLHRLKDVPTRVISAEEDPIAPPRLGFALSNLIPGAQYSVVKDAAHGVVIEHAAMINSMLLNHIQAVEATRSVR